MKSIFMTLTGLALISSSAALANERSPRKNILSYTIDWNQPESLDQDRGIGCDTEGAKVILIVPGRLNKDFRVEAPEGECKRVAVLQSRTNSVLIYEGDSCYSDNDQNFFVHELGPSGKPTGRLAAITADSGC